MPSRADLQAQLEAADKKWGIESLYYFSRFVLGYSLMQPDPHREVCRFAEQVVSARRRGLDLEPRGSFKTTIFSQALPVWLLVKNPEIRILLDSTVLQNSIDNLGVIKRHLEDPRFRYLYGDFAGSHWTLEEITIARRTRRDLKEPSVRCASPERVQVGPHYDVIIADDLVSRENVNTPEQRAFIKDHFRLLFSLLEPDGILIVVGTRWNYDDLYGMIMGSYGEFDLRIKQAEDASGKLYFKERLTKDFLEQQRRNLGRDLFASQYLNDPAPEDAESKFQKDWFKPYVDLPKSRYGFIAIDPGGEKKGSDEWAMMTAFCDEKNDLYFDNLLRGNWRVDKAWNILFDLVEQVDPVTVGLETTAGQRYLLESLQDEMRRRNRFFHVEALVHAGDAKEYRIQRLQPRYQCGSVWHSAAMEPLEEQLRRFPKGKDDLADVASMILEIALAPRSRTSRQTVIRSVDDLVWKALREKKEATPAHRTLGSEW